MGEKKYTEERSVSFIDQEAEAWIRREAPEDGLCLKKFRADYVVKDLKNRHVGEIVEAGGQRFELTAMGKRCFSECGLLQRTGKKCLLASGAAFGKKK